jgi:RsiW-degrading membrane proteinase PrsW (M82 family)
MTFQLKILRFSMDPLSYLLYVVLFVIAPIIFYLWFFHRRDKWEREPLRLMLTIFLIGAIPVVVLALILESAAGLFISAAAGTIIAAPIIEEILKWGGVRLFAYNRKEFNEPLDGFVYGAAVALGFAAVETSLYVTGPLLVGDWAAASFQAVVRGVIPGHVFYTGTSCFFLGVAKFMPKGARRYGVMIGGLVLAIALHMTWNGGVCTIISASVIAGLLAAIVFGVACWVLVGNWINAGLNRSPFNPTRRTPLPSAVIGAHVSKVIPPADFTAPPRTQGVARSGEARFCPRCGTPLDGDRFCPNCGTPLSGAPSWRKT